MRKAVAFSAGGDGGGRSPDICCTTAGIISRHRKGGPLIKYPKLPWTRLFTPAAFPVVAAVTLAWWGFLAWLIWRVI